MESLVESAVAERRIVERWYGRMHDHARPRGFHIVYPDIIATEQQAIAILLLHVNLKSIVVVIYSIWFMKKSHKELLDKLKLSWVVFIIIKTVSGIVFNYPLPLVIHYISSLLLITAFVCYLINGFKNKTIFIKHVS